MTMTMRASGPNRPTRRLVATVVLAKAAVLLGTTACEPAPGSVLLDRSALSFASLDDPGFRTVGSVAANTDLQDCADSA